MEDGAGQRGWRGPGIHATDDRGMGGLEARMLEPSEEKAGEFRAVDACCEERVVPSFSFRGLW